MILYLPFGPFTSQKEHLLALGCECGASKSSDKTIMHVARKI